MRAKPKNHAKNLERLKELSRTIHSSMEDGSFYELSYFERYRKIREIKKLYNKLLGSLSEASLRAAVSFASVLVLLAAPGCDDAAQGTATVQINPGVKGSKLAPVKSTAYVPPDVTGLTLTVSGPGIKTSTIKVSPGEDSIMLSVPAGKDRVFSVRADTATVYFYFGRATIDLNNGDMINLPISMVRGPEFVASTLQPGIDNGLFTYNTYPSFGDLDSDGDLDLLVSTDSYSYGFLMYYFQNNGGTFSSVATPAGLGTAHQFKTFVDIDSDGDLDVFGSIGISTYCYSNTGTAGSPNFSPYPVMGPSVTTFTTPIPSFADIDKDGDYDLFLGGLLPGASYSINVTFFRNDGTSSVPSWADVALNAFGLANITGRNAFSPTFVDIDNDGDLDMFLGVGHYYGMPLYIYYSQIHFCENIGTAASPIFATPQTNLFGLSTISANRVFPAFADIDRDGDQDLFLGTSDGTILYYENVIIP